MENLIKAGWKYLLNFKKNGYSAEHYSDTIFVDYIRAVKSENEENIEDVLREFIYISHLGDEIEMDRSTCEYCDTYEIGESRCSCSNRRIHLQISLLDDYMGDLNVTFYTNPW